MSTPATPRLVVVDATGYLFRAFHAIREMSTPTGRPTNAIYGVTTSLGKIRELNPGATIVCVMDAAGKTFRHEMYPEYKATRKETAQELIDQIAPTKQFIEAMGFPLYCVAGVEADDVIATLAAQAIAQRRDCVVATSDKDLMCLAASGCLILDPKTDVFQDAEAVTKKFGVKAALIPDYLALIGDSSDNIPGVPKVGKVTAAKWLNEYGDLAGVIAAKEQIKGKVGENLRANLDQLALSRQLVTLREDVALDENPALYEVGTPDRERLADLCKEFSFSSRMQERLAKVSKVVQRQQEEVTILTATAQIRELGEIFAKHNQIGVHIATSEADARRTQIVGVALVVPGHNYYLPVAHVAFAKGETPANADVQEVQQLLAKLTGLTDCELRMFGVKEALHALRNAEIDVACRVIDVGLLAYCDSSNNAPIAAVVAQKYLDYAVPALSEMLGGRDQPKEFAQLDVATAAHAAHGWAQTALEAREPIGTRMGNDKLKLFRRVEDPALASLLAMEYNGICIDQAKIAELDQQFMQQKQQLHEELIKVVGQEFNPNSTKDVAAILYDELKLDAGRKTRGGKLSTKETELERLANNTDSPVPRLLLDYRHVTKLSSTYTAALPKYINPETQRVHTQFIQAGAVTGRLASKHPNLQNIPIRSEEGKQIRQCFVAPQGNVLVSADYSQIELRILAHFSQDETLLASFAEGQDVHQRTAAEIFEIPPEQVDAEQRRIAKTINFGLIYGMGVYGLADRLKIPRKKSKEIIEIYFQRLPGVRKYLDDLKQEAGKTNLVTTLHKREISFSQTYSNFAGAQRAATNAPMQGTAADIMKLAMAAVHEQLASNFPAALLLLQVHDELIVEIPQAQAAELAVWLKEVMSSVAELAVPLVVDTGSGNNWDEAH